MKAVLVDYGAGNLRSVSSAFARAGVAAEVTGDPAAVREAQLAVIAGVGNAESAARRLEADGLADVLRQRVAAGRPVLGICLGMQLLFEESEEGGCGLGVLRGPVTRLRAGRVPHMGWNTLRVTAPSALLDGLDGEDVYFAHSFACEPADGVVVAEVALRFGGDHVGGLPLTLLPHALERFAMQAGITLHVEASGEDDHHVAEAAFKALGRALREACATNGAAPVGSTKGSL